MDNNVPPSQQQQHQEPKSSTSQNCNVPAPSTPINRWQKYKVFEKLKKLSGGTLFAGSVPGQL